MYCRKSGVSFESDKIQPAISYIKNVPSVWNETIILQGSQIGKLAIIARRKGKDWFLGILNGSNALQVQISCNFLGNGEYKSEIFLDDTLAKPINLEGLNPRANLTKFKTAVPFKKEVKICDEKSILTLDIAKNGGAVVWFKNNLDIN